MKFKAAFAFTVVAPRTRTWYLLCRQVLATTVLNTDTDLSKKASKMDSLPPHMRFCHSSFCFLKPYFSLRKFK